MKKRILSLALAVLMVLSLLPATAYAASASGRCGTNARWSLDSAGTLTISGTGQMEDYIGGTAPWASYSAQIKKVVIQSGITYTGYNAFEGCSNLKTVSLPTTLTEIGGATFDECSSLTSVKLPSRLKSIGDFAFSGCVQLASITLPASLESIGKYSFFDCESIKTITIPAKVTSIPDKAFDLCGKLTAVTLPAGLKEIGNGAFSLCRSLKTVNFKGTSAQWKKVAVGSYNSELDNAVIKCSNATIAKKYTVTFNANGGTVAQGTKSVTKGSTYGSLPVPKWSGYTFNGWYTSASGGTKVTSATKYTRTGNQTLYAHWTKNTVKKYVVTFNANGGTVSQGTKSVTKGGTYGSLPVPKWSGYTFSGWYTSASGGTKVTSATKYTRTSNQTLYAHWTKKSGGTGGSTSKPITGAVIPDLGKFVKCGIYYWEETHDGYHAVQCRIRNNFENFEKVNTAATEYLKLLENNYAVKRIYQTECDARKYGYFSQTYAYNYTGTSKTVKNFHYEKQDGPNWANISINCAIVVHISYSHLNYAYLTVYYSDGLTPSDPGKNTSVKVEGFGFGASGGTGTGGGTGGSTGGTGSTVGNRYCNVCRGTGRVTCHQCSGLGHEPDGKPCRNPLCSGGKKRCSYCGGDGRY